MKEELIDAAQRAFEQTVMPHGHCWWGYDFVTTNMTTYFFASDCTVAEDYSHNTLFHPSRDDPCNVWFLLLCAEAAGDADWNA